LGALICDKGGHVESQFGEKVLTRKNCPIHYWLSGPNNRPLVIFTHGAGVDHRSFNLIIPSVEKEYKVLNWDVRGHGLSRPMGETFSIPLAVEDLLAILETMGYKEAAFIGHSNGTYISQEFAFRFPKMVKAIVIADGTCITWPRTIIDKIVLKSSTPIMSLLPEQTLKKAGLPYFSNRKEVQNYAYEAFSMIPKKEFLEIWNAAASCLHDEPNYRITQPMLLIHGDNDQTGDIKKIAPLWAKQSQNCQYEVIPNAMHLAPMDNPEVFNRLVIEFLHKWIPV
jgi:3-oxoadipate enol-lactonase